LPKRSREKAAPGKTASLPIKEFREAVVRDAERDYLQELMATTQGNIQKACRISGLARARLYELLKKRGIPPSN
jgi:two-component system, NtrC family, response regulator